MITDMAENYDSGGKRLLRRKDGRMVAGVCAGIAAYFDIDVTLVRLGFGIFSILYGVGLLIYVAAWVIVPEEGEGGSILESLLKKF